jgi:hypothetical protein
MRRAFILALETALCASAGALAAPLSAAWAAPAKTAPVAAKAEVDPSISPPGWKAPKNVMGQPDISGYWTNATMTPLTRNPKLTDKLVVPDKDAKGLERAFAEALAEADRPTDQKKGPGKVTDKDSAEAKLVAIRPDFAAAGGDVGGYNTFWIDPGAHMMRVNGEYRSSITATSTTATRTARSASAASWASDAIPPRRCCPTATTTTTTSSPSRRTPW